MARNQQVAYNPAPSRVQSQQTAPLYPGRQRYNPIRAEYVGPMPERVLPGGVQYPQATRPQRVLPQLPPVPSQFAVVQSGDNWFNMAQRYNVTPDTLRNAAGTNSLRAGQRIKLPATPQGPTPNLTTPQNPYTAYSVVPGADLGPAFSLTANDPGGGGGIGDPEIPRTYLPGKGPGDNPPGVPTVPAPTPPGPPAPGGGGATGRRFPGSPASGFDLPPVTDRSDVTDYLLGQGVDPILIYADTAARLGLDPISLTALGYTQTENGNWLRMDAAGGGDTGGYYGSGRRGGRYRGFGGRGGGGSPRGGGGGGWSDPRTGLRMGNGASRTGRTGYGGGVGPISWRI